MSKCGTHSQESNSCCQFNYSKAIRIKLVLTIVHKNFKICLCPLDFISIAKFSLCQKWLSY